MSCQNILEKGGEDFKNLPDKIEAPRNISKEGEIQEIYLHAFGDSSGNEVTTAIYTTATQDLGTSQGLLTVKMLLFLGG